ncbi:MAG: helix-turn-helix domain-containing protein [Bacteroidales bacterium]|jgi:predicted DNA-binding transcriptional regulator YafY|nr:helix-turn-helix domain-containing protein [Bacteroidales bacterium]
MILKAKDLLVTLHQLIENGSTGSPAELAQRLDVTARTVKKYISDLRKLGAKIEFCSHLKTYYYSEPVTLYFGYKPVDDNDDPSIGKGEEA